MRRWYRMMLGFFTLLVVVASVEHGSWSLVVIAVGYGFAVWRSELPTWDQLWSRRKS